MKRLLISAVSLLTLTGAVAYDDLHRLTEAAGRYPAAMESATYDVEMSYDRMHRITNKRQDLARDEKGVSAGYSLGYSYSTEPGQRFRLGTVTDAHYRGHGTSGDAEKPTISDVHSYRYDDDGNMTYVSTARNMADGTVSRNLYERKLIWDTENRMTASDDNGYVTTYVYDADGNRTVKQSGCGGHMYVDSEKVSGKTMTEDFTLYVGPWMTVNRDGQYTKHIYAGSERIVSQVGDTDNYLGDQFSEIRAGHGTGAAAVDYLGKYRAQTARIKALYDEFEVPYNGRDNHANNPDLCGVISALTGNGQSHGSTESDGEDAASDDETATSDDPEKSFGTTVEEEAMRFFYHPDHLGSSSRITDATGKVVQRLEYLPYGEVFLDKRNGDWNTPYLFNAKELDEETGLYYYGARYYNPRLGVWLSTDPMQEKFANYSSYCFSNNSPVVYVDPDGRSTMVKELGNRKYEVIGGDLNDNDRNIYVYTQDRNGQYTVKGKSIGITSSITSFYNSDKSEWAIGSVIKHDDVSGIIFLSDMLNNEHPLFDDYIMGARNNHTYDFKATNGGIDVDDKNSDIYRGMPIGVTSNGQTIYSSARDIGNIVAGYIAAVNGIPWEIARLGFDAYQSYHDGHFSMEGRSTVNAQRYGWSIGHNTTSRQKSQAFHNSIKSLVKAICRYGYNYLRNHINSK